MKDRPRCRVQWSPQAVHVQFWRCCFAGYRLNAGSASQRSQNASVPSGEYPWRQSHCRHASSSGKSARKSASTYRETEVGLSGVFPGPRVHEI